MSEDMSNMEHGFIVLGMVALGWGAAVWAIIKLVSGGGRD
jgi:hypothetical protein